MASPADWVEGIKPDDTAVDVARRVVSQRFGMVWHYLPRAAKNPEEDVEHVHRLRVATRRAAAAAGVFRDLARQKRYRQSTNGLKQIRRAAAAARDLDVLCARLQQGCWEASEDGLAQAIAVAGDRRKQVQDPLMEVYRRGKSQGWKKRAKKLARSTSWRDSRADQLFRDLAGQVLQTAADQFYSLADTKPTELQALHQLRIRAKKLRYTVEIVAGGLNGSLRTEVYPEILEIHERLGTMNDHATAAGVFHHWSEPEQAPGSAAIVLRDLMVSAQQQAEAARLDFLQWWSDERREDLRQRLRPS